MDLRSWNEAHVVKGCRTKRRCLMRADVEPGGCVCVEGECFRYDLCPGDAIAGHISREPGPCSGQLHPGVREGIRTTAYGTVEEVLDLDDPTRSHSNQKVG